MPLVVQPYRIYWWKPFPNLSSSCHNQQSFCCSPKSQYHSKCSGRNDDISVQILNQNLLLSLYNLFFPKMLCFNYTVLTFHYAITTHTVSHQITNIPIVHTKRNISFHLALSPTIIFFLFNHSCKCITCKRR